MRVNVAGRGAIERGTVKVASLSGRHRTRGDVGPRHAMPRHAAPAKSVSIIYLRFPLVWFHRLGFFVSHLPATL